MSVHETTNVWWEALGIIFVLPIVISDKLVSTPFKPIFHVGYSA